MLHLTLLTALAAPLASGDLVFQRSSSRQAVAIRAATGSDWTHVGLIRIVEGEPWVLEAVQPVQLVPFAQWRARGIDGEVLVRRPKEPVWDGQALARLDALQQAWLGRSYDLAFEPGEERLYCSELVWEAYRQAAGVELVALRPLGSYRIDPSVRRAAEQRWGTIPVDQLVVAPSDLVEANGLEPVEPPSTSRTGL